MNRLEDILVGCVLGMGLLSTTRDCGGSAPSESAEVEDLSVNQIEWPAMKAALTERDSIDGRFSTYTARTEMLKAIYLRGIQVQLTRIADSLEGEDQRDD